MHSVTRATILFCLALFASQWSCATRTAKRALEMEPIRQARVSPSDRKAGSTEGSAGVTRDGAATPLATSEECVETTVDDLAERLAKANCDAPAPSAEAIASGSKVNARVSAMPPFVAPGGRTELRVTFINDSTEKVSLYFKLKADAKLSVPVFEVAANDVRGKRVDLPSGKAPKASTTSSERTARITLLPGGTIKAITSWVSTRKKWSGANLISAGNLPLGTYALRISTPLLNTLEPLTLPVEVVR
jgi:hypothetical protein